MFGDLSGTVFEDGDKNGGNSAADSPLVGWTVNLYKGTTFVGSTTTTNLTTDGYNYRFPNQPAGAYRVCIVPATGSWRQTLPAPPGGGSACNDPVAAGELARGNPVTLSGATPNVDFGNVRVATVGGYLFNDANADGIQDLPGEGAVIPARNVYLFAGTPVAGSPPISTTSLPVNSSFSFGYQDVGATYTVCAESIGGEPQTYPNDGTTGKGNCPAVTGVTVNPVGWEFQLTAGGNTGLGFGSVDATIASCGTPFGSGENYRILLNSPPACEKSFLVGYTNENDRPLNLTATLHPVGGGGVDPDGRVHPVDVAPRRNPDRAGLRRYAPVQRTRKRCSTARPTRVSTRRSRLPRSTTTTSGSPVHSWRTRPCSRLHRPATTLATGS